MYYVYILASQTRGTLYIGMTNDISRRALEHREARTAGFTKDYRIKRLVYIETFEDALDAITREKRLKKWNRSWKIELIEKANPDWRDLWFDLNG
jgi:putative endonuclease